MKLLNRLYQALEGLAYLPGLPWRLDALIKRLDVTDAALARVEKSYRDWAKAIVDQRIQINPLDYPMGVDKRRLNISMVMDRLMLESIGQNSFAEYIGYYVSEEVKRWRFKNPEIIDALNGIVKEGTP